MIFIDKSIRREDFNEYTVRFLQDCLNQEGTFVPRVAITDSYGAFSKSDYKLGRAFPEGKRGWLPVLLEEQGGFCCYCMRRLKGEEVSVEHIVPEKFDGLNAAEEYAFYAKEAEPINHYVELGCVTEDRGTFSVEDIASMVKFPHLVAHSNLAAACTWKKNGREIGCCCNNCRGNHRILPLMLMPDVEQNINYGEDGVMEITYPNTDGIVIKTITNLKINNNTLVEVRLLWHKISLTDLNKEQLLHLDSIGRMRLFKQMFETDTFAEIDTKYSKYANGVNSTTPIYWNLLMEYDWYLSYYRERRRK